MSSDETPTAVPTRTLRRTVLLATGAALVAVSVSYLLASLSTSELTVTVGGRPPVVVPFGAAVFATLTAGFGAYVLALLAGRTRRPRRSFLIATLAGLLLSVVPPVQAAVDVPTAIWLLVMHAAAAVALIPLTAQAVPWVRPKDSDSRNSLAGAVRADRAAGAR